MELEFLLRMLDEGGIDVGVVMTITDLPELNPDALDLVAGACAAHPDRLYGLVRVHPWYGDEAIAILDRAFTRYGCFRGLKLHPVTTIAHPGGDASIRLVQRTAEHGWPTLAHCADEQLCTPLAWAQTAEACPEATLILGHMGGYHHVDEAIEVALRFSNVVLETSMAPYPAKIAEAVERLGAERVIYASDGPFCSPRVEVEKVRLAGLDPSAERLVLGENARRLYRLP
jgi:predicted TIM-barrel fold metal-dependent hydrolase